MAEFSSSFSEVAVAVAAALASIGPGQFDHSLLIHSLLPPLSSDDSMFYSFVDVHSLTDWLTVTLSSGERMSFCVFSALTPTVFVKLVKEEK